MPGMPGGWGVLGVLERMGVKKVLWRTCKWLREMVYYQRMVDLNMEE